MWAAAKNIFLGCAYFDLMSICVSYNHYSIELSNCIEMDYNITSETLSKSKFNHRKEEHSYVTERNDEHQNHISTTSKPSPDPNGTRLGGENQKNQYIRTDNSNDKIAKLTDITRVTKNPSFKMTLDHVEEKLTEFDQQQEFLQHSDEHKNHYLTTSKTPSYLNRRKIGGENQKNEYIRNQISNFEIASLTDITRVTQNPSFKNKRERVEKQLLMKFEKQLERLQHKLQFDKDKSTAATVSHKLDNLSEKVKALRNLPEDMEDRVDALLDNLANLKHAAMSMIQISDTYPIVQQLDLALAQLATIEPSRLPTSKRSEVFHILESLEQLRFEIVSSRDPNIVWILKPKFRAVLRELEHVKQFHLTSGLSSGIRGLRGCNKGGVGFVIGRLSNGFGKILSVLGRMH